jgi:hypothetical protein
VTLRKIVVLLDGAELSALNELAARERRDRQAQAAVIIRTALERRGLLNTPPAPLGQEERMNDAKRIQDQ